MSAIANLVAYSDTTTAHTFLPVSVSREGNSTKAEYRENRSGYTLEAQPTVSMELRALKSGVNQVSIEATVPLLETVGAYSASGYTAAPKLAHVLRSRVVFYFHPRSTESDRAYIRQIMANLVQGVSSAVTPITSGAVPDLVDRALCPT